MEESIYMVEETTGGSPSASITYYKNFKTPKEAEDEQAEFENKQEEFFPSLFKQKYEKEKDITIKELTYELLNNKVVSSKTKFIYKFTYIISKDDKEFLCTVSDVEINKIEDSYIFKNFKDLKEECTQR